MGKSGRLLLAGAALVLALPGTARADGFRNLRVCGGDLFQTCAAVRISVVGNNVTVDVWNLSGNTAGSFGTSTAANTIFNGIGFYNVPAGVDVVNGSLTMTGPVRPGDTPGAWKLKNNGMVGFNVDVAASTPGAANGIASGCAASASLPSSPPHLFMNPCSANVSSGGWTRFSFQITNTWNPYNTQITLRGINPSTGQNTECATGAKPANRTGKIGTCISVTPEPVSMTLLATGLAGMGGAGLFRRRKKNQHIA